MGTQAGWKFPCVLRGPASPTWRSNQQWNSELWVYVMGVLPWGWPAHLPLPHPHPGPGWADAVHLHAPGGNCPVFIRPLLFLWAINSSLHQKTTSSVYLFSFFGLKESDTIEWLNTRHNLYNFFGCIGFSLPREGLSLVVVLRLLIAVASLVTEYPH